VLFRSVHARALILDDAIAVMEREYASDLALDDVARRLATSRRQLQRCFGDSGGGGFRDRLTAIRMQRAAELLEDTALSVRRVAAAVGYRQPAQFAKAFARHHGQVPSEFRNGPFHLSTPPNKGAATA